MILPVDSSTHVHRVNVHVPSQVVLAAEESLALGALVFLGGCRGYLTRIVVESHELSQQPKEGLVPCNYLVVGHM